MKKFVTAIMLFASLLFSTVAYAQALKVSTGGPAGTYSKMFKEASNVCSTQIPLAEFNSSGSNQNIDRLIGNEVNGAFVQSDVLFYRSRNEDFSAIKTLITLHPEEVHVVALSVSKHKEGGLVGIGGKTVELNTINDLAGRRLVAAGGAFTTANVIRLQTEIPFQIEEVATVELALAAVADGRAHAALLVGGAPVGQVAALDRAYKLLAFPEATAAKLKNVYRPAKLNYSKMGAAGVQSVSTDSLFVTREYKTTKFVEGLSKLRTCLLTNISELSETTGTHAAWSKVDITNTGKWPYYSLPSAAPVVKK